MEVTVMQIFFGSCHQYSLVKASGVLYYLQGLEECSKWIFVCTSNGLCFLNVVLSMKILLLCYSDFPEDQIESSG